MVTFNRTELIGCLDSVKRFVSSKATHPILETVLFKPNKYNNGYSVFGFDLVSLGSYAVGLVDPVSSELLEFCLPQPGVVLKLLQSFKGNCVDFQFNDVAQQVTITDLSSYGGTGSSYDFNYFDGSEYPDTALDISEEAGSSGRWFSITADHLRTIWKMVRHSYSTDSTKFVLCGINFIFEDGKLTVQATDGHRATWYSCPIKCEEDDELRPITKGSFILKPEIVEASIGNGDIVTFYWNDNINATVVNIKGYKAEDGDSVQETKFWTGTIPVEGVYPNVAQLIPTQFENKMSFNADEMIGALGRINLITKEGIITLSFDTTGTHDLVCLENDEAKSYAVAHEEVPCALNLGDEDMQINFNLKYFDQAIVSLKALTQNDIYLNMNKRNQPVVFNLPGIEGGCLLMPIQKRE